MYIARTNREKRRQHVKIAKSKSKYNNFVNHEKKIKNKFKISFFFIEKKNENRFKVRNFHKKEKKRNEE